MNTASSNSTDAITQQTQQAITHHVAGRLAEAEVIYKRILESHPEHADALHLLGLIAHQSNQPTLAAELISKAIAVSPSAPMHCNLGVVFDTLGRMQEAELSFAEAIKANPQYAEAYFNFGSTLFAQKKYEDAAQRYRKAIEINPQYTQAHINLGVTLNALELLDDAAESYIKAITIDPGHPDAYFNLGNTYKAQNKLEQAADSYSKAILIAPDYTDAQFNLGIVQQAQGKQDDAILSYKKTIQANPEFFDAHVGLGNIFFSRREFETAIVYFQSAIAIRAASAEVHCSLGNVYFAQEDFGHAASSYLEAISLDSSQFEALNNLGLVYLANEETDRAIELFKKSISANPKYELAYSNLGLAFQGQGNLDQAIEYYHQALEIKPGYIDAHSNLIFSMDMHPDMDAATLQQERRRWGQLHADKLHDSTLHPNTRDPSRKLRIGYISGDFRQHSAASIFSAMLTNFDREYFEIVAYSNSRKSDQHTNKLMQSVTGWRTVAGMPDADVAQLIRQDKIDILVDLAGHSCGNRLPVFARKPAPIQITAWGYIGGTGMQAMDYFFADEILVPPEEKQLYAEEVRYLPTVACYYSFQPLPPVNTLPALSGHCITFGSFNRLTKITEESFRTWAQVLLVVPHSRMVLKTPELDQPSEQNRVLEAFARCGISADKITLLGRTTWIEHMAAFNQIDISLDPFPHGGGVTAYEGIMMGVPMVTLRCPTIPGRISAAILTPLGLADWVAESPEEYVSIAVKKTRDLAALAVLRRQLRKTMTSSLLGNPEAYARVVEQEYRILWQRWCEL